MVRVRGQIEQAPLVDIPSIRKEYWSRKEVMLPSLKNFMPYEEMSWWKQLLHRIHIYKPRRPAPKVILRRLSEEEWISIDERFAALKMELVKDKAKLTKLAQKVTAGKDLSKAEWKLLHYSHRKSLPIYIAMLECMIEKPEMTYQDTQVLVDALDDVDRNHLMSYVNMMTTEKAEVAKKLYDEQIQQMNQQMDRMVKP